MERSRPLVGSTASARRCDRRAHDRPEPGPVRTAWCPGGAEEDPSRRQDRRARGQTWSASSRPRSSTSNHAPAPRRRVKRRQPARPRSAPCARWLALDDYNGILYRKDYTLQAVGEKIEVWVAERHVLPGRRLPQHRCRTPPRSPDAQVAGAGRPVRHQHVPEGVGRPSASPPDRDGSGNVGRRGVDYTGDGDKIVTLVDNVRDDNYYDFPAAPTYIAGFFSSQFNELLDRNVMTIDAFDWAHRTGANPPDAADRRPVHQPPGPRRACTRAPSRTSTSTCCSTTRTRTRSTGSTRACRTSRRRWSATATRTQDGLREGRREPHLLLPGLRHGPDDVQPEPARLRRSGELADPVG